MADPSSSCGSSASASAPRELVRRPVRVHLPAVGLLPGHARRVGHDGLRHRGGASVLLFFGSLLAHELGHALVARRLGVEILGIDLWLFGGIAKMGRDPQTPKAPSSRSPSPGPSSRSPSSPCAWVSAPSWWAGRLPRRGPPAQGVDVTPGCAARLAGLDQRFLLVFNLLPAFPLDGGRIARAIVWRVTGDRPRSTRFSARAGAGARLHPHRLRHLPGSAHRASFNGLWLGLLGWFLAPAAARRRRPTRSRSASTA